MCVSNARAKQRLNVDALNCTADLKKAVYAIFSQFGKILDVVALKTYRLRGQAWVVFADIRSAGEAIRTMQGFPFFDKPMVRAPCTCLG